jgi:2'-5' RNA ligase
VIIAGLSLAELDRLRDQAAAVTIRQVRATLRAVTRPWRAGADVNIDDLGKIRGDWDRRVDEQIIPQVWAAYWHGVDHPRRQIAAHLGVTAAATDTPPPPADPVPLAVGVHIARVTNPVASAWMEQARNRLVRVGDEIWEHARGELLTGMAAGEGIAKLADRVSSVAAVLAEPRAEVIARTEVNSAANAGEITQLRSFDLPTATKTWLATEDERTRPEHADADGQTVAIDETFDVDGEALDHPGDPSGSPGNIINCRCTATFEIPDDDVEGLAEAAAAEEDALTAAAAEEHTGAMIALVPSKADLDRLALPDGEPAGELHLTLFFLGEATGYAEGVRTEMADKMAKLFAGFGEIPAVAFGVNYWNPGGDQPAWVLAVGDDPDGETGVLYDAQTIAEGVIDPSILPPQHSPWVPHICLAYDTPDVQDTTRLNEMIPKLGPVTFDTVRLAFGTETHDVAL